MNDTSIYTTSLLLLGLILLFGMLLLLFRKLFLSGAKSKNLINMQVISKLPIQPKVNLYIVKAGSKMLLLGVSDKSISTLADVTPLKAVKQNGKAIIKSASDFSASADSSNPLKNKELKTDSLSFATFLQSLFKKQKN